jgi:hypothetical protein
MSLAFFTQLQYASVTDNHIMSIVNGRDSIIDKCFMNPRPIDCVFEVFGYLNIFFQAPQTGLAAQVSNGFFSSKNVESVDCLTLPCTDLKEDQQTSKEVRAANEIFKKVHGDNPSVPPEFRNMQEFLRFRIDDPRDKFLYLSGDNDHNGALEPHWMTGFWGFLAQGFDLKYKEFSNLETVCSEIKNGALAGQLMYVLLHVHGNHNVMAPGKPIWKSEDFSSCFSGLASHGKVILFSCSVGASHNNNPFDNIAQKIADDAKRQVIAPTKTFYSDFFHLSPTDADQLLVYHPENIKLPAVALLNSNLMQVFEPKYNDCTKLEEGDIKDREKKAAIAIRDNLLSKSLLHPETPFQATREYLRFCKDDPKEKFLFLSAQYDDSGKHSSFFDPQNSASMLGMLSQRFDISYQVVGSVQELCDALSKAAKMGPLTGVMIQGMREGNGYSSFAPNGVVLSNANNHTEILDENMPSEYANKASTKCFSWIKKSGTIIFLGSFLGRNEPKDPTFRSVAQHIANKNKRTVVASKCPVYAESIRVTSLNPLELMHPSLGWYDRLRDSRTKTCPATEENLFGVFQPENSGK